VLLRGIGGEIGQDGDFMIFEGSRYRGGFMYKTLAMSAIVSSIYQLSMYSGVLFSRTSMGTREKVQDNGGLG